MTDEELKKIAEHCREVQEFQAKAQHVKNTAHAGTCPNCGYCPHCGRSNANPWWQWPDPYRWTRPWMPAYPPPPPSVTPVWTGGMTVMGDSVPCKG